jgi:hypothetical protein
MFYVTGTTPLFYLFLLFIFIIYFYYLFLFSHFSIKHFEIKRGGGEFGKEWHEAGTKVCVVIVIVLSL